MAHQIIVTENATETIYDLSVMTIAEAEEMMRLWDDHFENVDPTAEDITEYEQYEAIIARG